MRKNPAVRQRVRRNLRQLRTLRGLSRAKLVATADETERHLGRIERLEVGMSIDYAAALAKLLGVDVSELFKIRRVKPEQRIYIVGEAELRALEQGMSDVDQSLARLRQIIKRIRRTGD